MNCANMLVKDLWSSLRILRGNYFFKHPSCITFLVAKLPNENVIIFNISSVLRNYLDITHSVQFDQKLIIKLWENLVNWKDTNHFGVRKSSAEKCNTFPLYISTNLVAWILQGQQKIFAPPSLLYAFVCVRRDLEVSFGAEISHLFTWLPLLWWIPIKVKKNQPCQL